MKFLMSSFLASILMIAPALAGTIFFLIGTTQAQADAFNRTQAVHSRNCQMMLSGIAAVKSEGTSLNPGDLGGVSVKITAVYAKACLKEVRAETSNKDAIAPPLTDLKNSCRWIVSNYPNTSMAIDCGGI
jgi:hypothetical protein